MDSTSSTAHYRARFRADHQNAERALSISVFLGHVPLFLTLRQAVLQLAVQGRLVEQDPSDEPASVLLKEVIQNKRVKKHDKIPLVEADELHFELPNGWIPLRLGHIATVVRGGSPRPAGDKKYYDGNIPFLKVADITATEDVFYILTRTL